MIKHRDRAALFAAIALFINAVVLFAGGVSLIHLPRNVGLDFVVHGGWKGREIESITKQSSMLVGTLKNVVISYPPISPEWPSTNNRAYRYVSCRGDTASLGSHKAPSIFRRVVDYRSVLIEVWERRVELIECVSNPVSGIYRLCPTAIGQIGRNFRSPVFFVGSGVQHGGDIEPRRINKGLLHGGQAFFHHSELAARDYGVDSGSYHNYRAKYDVGLSMSSAAVKSFQPRFFHCLVPMLGGSILMLIGAFLGITSFIFRGPVLGNLVFASAFVGGVILFCYGVVHL